MPGRNPFRRARRTQKKTDRPFDFERERVFEGYDPLDDGFAYPASDQKQLLIPSTLCECTVVPPASVIVEQEDTERAFRASRVKLCDHCIGKLVS